MGAPAIAAAIPAIIAAATAAAQGIGAAAESQLPENLMSEAEWIQQKTGASGRALDVGVGQQAGLARRSLAKETGPKAEYLGLPAGSGGLEMDPAVLRRMMARRRQLQHRIAGQAHQEQLGLKGASGQRLAMFGGAMGLLNKAAGGLAGKSLEGTALEGLDIGTLTGAMSGGLGALGAGGLDMRGRRGGGLMQGQDMPLFGGGYGGLYG